MTTVQKTSDGWQLLRNGKPYTIKGVGGTAHPDVLVEAGGNSMRTWGPEQAARELDECQKYGLTLTIGIWLGHKDSFDYSDPAKVRQQYESTRAVVEKYKDHPALLMWGLGNEMEMGNDTPELWKAIEDLAKLCKKLDPSHPTMTVVAEISPEKIAHIKQYAPSIDVLGVNSYGSMPTMPKRLKEAGWDKPYVVTEFGPVGWWERPKTPWGAALEPTSSEKAAFYAKSYHDAVEVEKGWCLGSYAFLWGHKQEQTPTWFGMFLPTGERTESIDVMTYAWSGKWPKNRVPSLVSFEMDQSGKDVAPGAEISAAVKAKDEDGDPLTYLWEIRKEAGTNGYAGQGERTPPPIPGLVDNLGSPRIKFKAPSEAGAYRLYITVKDGKGNAATANLPFRVTG